MNSALVLAIIHGKATTSHIMAYFTNMDTYDDIRAHSAGYDIEEKSWPWIPPLRRQFATCATRRGTKRGSRLDTDRSGEPPRKRRKLNPQSTQINTEKPVAIDFL